MICCIYLKIFCYIVISSQCNRLENICLLTKYSSFGEEAARVEREINETDIIPSFRDSLFRDSTDILKEYGEIAIDTILGQGLLSSLPIVSTVAAICKTGLNIKERNYLRQTIAFIKGFNSGNMEQSKIDEYREKLISDRIKAEQELGRIVVILDSTIEQEQSEVLGRFYKAYIYGNYDWDMFRQLSAANQKLFYNDYETLSFINYDTVCSENITPLQRSSIERLQAVGLVLADGEIIVTCGTSVLNKYWYYLSDLGVYFNFYSVAENVDKKLRIKR